MAKILVMISMVGMKKSSNALRFLRILRNSTKTRTPSLKLWISNG